MASLGKYTNSRKQELKLQKELETIRKKAMLDLYHGKQHEVSGNDKLQGTGDNDPISLKPPSKPKPTEFPGRRKPRPHKVPLKEQKKRIITNPLEKVKFAITSSLETSTPVSYAERHHPVKFDRQVKPEKYKQDPVKKDVVNVPTDIVIKPMDQFVVVDESGQGSGLANDGENGSILSVSDRSEMSSSEPVCGYTSSSDSRISGLNSVSSSVGQGFVPSGDIGGHQYTSTSLGRSSNSLSQQSDVKMHGHDPFLVGHNSRTLSYSDMEAHDSNISNLEESLTGYNIDTERQDESQLEIKGLEDKSLSLVGDRTGSSSTVVSHESGTLKLEIDLRFRSGSDDYDVEEEDIQGSVSSTKSYPSTIRVSEYERDNHQKSKDESDEIHQSLEDESDEIHQSLEDERDEIHQRLEDKRREIHQSLEDESDEIHQSLEDERDEIHQRLEDKRHEIHQRSEDEGHEIHQSSKDERDEINQRLEDERDEINQRLEEERDETHQRLEDEMHQRSEDALVDLIEEKFIETELLEHGMELSKASGMKLSKKENSLEDEMELYGMELDRGLQSLSYGTGSSEMEEFPRNETKSRDSSESTITGNNQSDTSLSDDEQVILNTKTLPIITLKSASVSDMTQTKKEAHHSIPGLDQKSGIGTESMQIDVLTSSPSSSSASLSSLMVSSEKNIVTSLWLEDMSLKKDLESVASSCNDSGSRVDSLGMEDGGSSSGHGDGRGGHGDDSGGHGDGGGSYGDSAGDGGGSHGDGSHGDDGGGSYGDSAGDGGGSHGDSSHGDDGDDDSHGSGDGSYGNDNDGNGIQGDGAGGGDNGGDDGGDDGGGGGDDDNTDKGDDGDIPSESSEGLASIANEKDLTAAKTPDGSHDQVQSSTVEGLPTSTDMERTMDHQLQEMKETAHTTLAEFLAFSDGPITLEDIMAIKGTKVKPVEPTAKENPISEYKGLSHVITDRKTRQVADVDIGGVAGHASIHHFCTMPDTPQLPYSLQVLSRQTHVNLGRIYSKTDIQDGNIEVQDRCSNIQDRYSSIQDRDNVRDKNSVESSRFVHFPSNKRKPTRQTPREKPLDVFDEDKSNDIVYIAKTRLKHEVKKIGQGKSTQLDRRKIKPVVLNSRERTAGDDGSREGSRDKSVGDKIVGHELYGEESGKDVLVLTGMKMQVIKNPSSLLWSPAPPKLSLYPTTIQSCLFPKYEPPHQAKFIQEQLQTEEQGQTEEQEEQGQTEVQEEHEGVGRRLDLHFHSLPVFSTLGHHFKGHAPISPNLIPPPPSQASEAAMGERPTNITITLPQRSIDERQADIDTTSPQRNIDRKAEEDGEEIPLEKSILLPRYKSSKTCINIGWKREDALNVEGVVNVKGVVRSSQSVPLLMEEVGDSQTLVDDMGKNFEQTMAEVKRQRDQLLSHHKEKQKYLKIKLEEGLETDSDTNVSSSNLHVIDDTSSSSKLSASGALSTRKLRRNAIKSKKATSRFIRRTMSAQLRTKKARELIFLPPRPLKRQLSYPLLKNELENSTEQEPSLDYRKTRRLSLPTVDHEHFLSLMRSHGENPDNVDEYKWAFDLWWNMWFPDTLKECRDEIAELYPVTHTRFTIPTLRFAPCSVTKIRRRALTKEDHVRLARVGLLTKKKDKLKMEAERMKEDEFVALENIRPPASFSTYLIESFESKVKKLTELLSECEDTSMQAIYHCRKGALLRKLGRLKDSFDELYHAILLEPSLSDAYWHRHFLFLIQGDTQRALDDLSVLLKHNKHHYGGSCSKALILVKQNNLASALFHLTHAINMNPTNQELYFMRAEVHEKRGEFESALADYSCVTKLDPIATEPLRRQAMYKFNRSMWAASTQYFTALLLRDPNNTSARIHRAKAHCNMGHYLEALQDLSATIHLDPNGSFAFFNRACLLRKCYPRQALRDYSLSILLDDSVNNVDAFLHRGILYTEMKCYKEALADFESAIKIKRSLPFPHVCAGLLYMNHLGKQLMNAILCFTAAITVDPTCIRAYLCRAESYKKDSQYELAALDYTRLIHMDPSNHIYYLYKGEMYVLMKKYKMASLHVEIASKLSSGSNHSKIQRALISSFLGNHHQAISIMGPGVPNRLDDIFLMGRIQYKAALFSGSIESYKKAIEVLKEELKRITYVGSRRRPGYCIKPMRIPIIVTKETLAEFHFLCGLSLVENRSFREAIEEFSKVLHLIPKHEKACYERGVARLRIGQEVKGLLDLNKSLALNPMLFQSYLARAAHYGKIGRYTKAILNCNEAIKITPNSVRAHLSRGALKYITKSYQGAIEDLTTAINLDPNQSSLSLFNRALCYQATNRPIKAISDYSMILLMKENIDSKILINRGLQYLTLKDYGNALLDFIGASKTVTKDPAIFQAIGYCYHQFGSLDSSIEAYTEAINLDPLFLEAIVGRGNAYMDYLKDETNKLCKADYLHALQLDPSHLPAHVNLAFLLQSEGKFQEAWNALTSALEYNKRYVPALEARAIINLQMSNFFAAFMDLTDAIEIERTATLLTNRGVVNQFMGDTVSAMNDYQAAIKLDHTYVLAHFNIGTIEFHQRLFTHALASYSKALSHCVRDDDSILVNRAITYSILRDMENALADFRRAISANPYSAHAYFNRGNLNKSLGEYEKAEDDYKKALELQPEDWLTLYYYGEVQGKQGRMESATENFRKAAHFEL